MRRVILWASVAVLLVACGSNDALPEDLRGRWVSTSMTGLEVSVYRGHEHCETQTIAELQMHDITTGERRYYLRDPGDAVRKFLPQAPNDKFASLGELPPDAEDTGFRHGNATLWLSPDASFAYIAVEGEVERWPRWGQSLNDCD
jgi:hypothetical protein